MISTIYLAGPIDYVQFDQASRWRHQAAKMLADRGFLPLSPLRGKETYIAAASAKGLPTSEWKSILHRIPIDGEFILTRDLADIDASDCLLVNVGPADARLTGTVAECFYAARVCAPRKMVVAFVEEGQEPCEQTKSPWFGHFFTPQYHVHHSLSSAVDWISLLA
jgi:nucleoside 2-deoxyribosyltransferase